MSLQEYEVEFDDGFKMTVEVGDEQEALIEAGFKALGIEGDFGIHGNPIIATRV
jgi:hypothetical protein